MNSSLPEFDPQVFEIANEDLARQQSSLTLIPSENYASKAVMQAQATVLANKYAEGYPYQRYYNGCLPCDKIETLAIERAKDLFGAEHVMGSHKISLVPITILSITVLVQILNL